MHLGAAHPGLHSEQLVQACRQVIDLTLQIDNAEPVFSLHFSDMSIWALSTTVRSARPAVQAYAAFVPECD